MKEPRPEDLKKEARRLQLEIVPTPEEENISDRDTPPPPPLTPTQKGKIDKNIEKRMYDEEPPFWDKKNPDGRAD